MKNYSKYYKKLSKKYKMKSNKNYEINESNLFVSMVLIYLTLALNIGISLYRMYKINNQGTVLDRKVLSEIFLNKFYIVAVLFFTITYIIPVYKKYLNEFGKNKTIAKILIAYLSLALAIKVPLLNIVGYGVWIVIHYTMFKDVSTTKNFLKILFALFICFIASPYLFNNIFSILGIIAAIVLGWVLFGAVGTGVGEAFTPSAPKVQTKVNNKNELKTLEYKSGVKFYRCENLTGYKYIKQVNFYGSSEVCSQKDFDSGRVVIKQNGKQVTFIPKEPK